MPDHNLQKYIFDVMEAINNLESFPFYLKRRNS